MIGRLRVLIAGSLAAFLLIAFGTGPAVLAAAYGCGTYGASAYGQNCPPGATNPPSSNTTQKSTSTTPAATSSNSGNETSSTQNPSTPGSLTGSTPQTTTEVPDVGTALPKSSHFFTWLLSIGLILLGVISALLVFLRRRVWNSENKD